jgi:endonuclease/exonuclease/phosphatase family metal-dependent hydrolase
MRNCQVGLLLAALEPFRGERAILLGDMNFRRRAATSGLLEAGGWQLAAAEESWTIDQVWVGPGATWQSEPLWEADSLPPHLSDHYPVGARLYFSEHERAGPLLPLEAPGTEHACAPG